MMYNARVVSRRAHSFLGRDNRTYLERLVRSCASPLDKRHEKKELDIDEIISRVQQMHELQEAQERESLDLRTSEPDGTFEP